MPDGGKQSRECERPRRAAGGTRRKNRSPQGNPEAREVRARGERTGRAGPVRPRGSTRVRKFKKSGGGDGASAAVRPPSIPGGAAQPGPEPNPVMRRPRSRRNRSPGRPCRGQGEEAQGARRDQARTAQAPARQSQPRRARHRLENDLRAEIISISGEALEEMGVVLNREERATLNQDLYDEVTGLGPLEPLLKDDTHQRHSGQRAAAGLRRTRRRWSLRTRPSRTNGTFCGSSTRSSRRGPPGRRIEPLCRRPPPGRLALQRHGPPMAVDGRSSRSGSSRRKSWAIDDLVSFGAFTEEMAAYLQAAVATRLNVIVSGGTGSGKTTTLNALSSFIDNDERILTIEDTAELQLQQTHVGRMESRPPNVEGKRRGHPARLSAQRAADAPRPHHRRRDARRGGHRHAAGHEHRPRRVDDDDPRQLARDAVSRWKT